MQKSDSWYLARLQPAAQCWSDMEKARVLYALRKFDDIIEENKRFREQAGQTTVSNMCTQDLLDFLVQSELGVPLGVPVWDKLYSSTKAALQENLALRCAMQYDPPEDAQPPLVWRNAVAVGLDREFGATHRDGHGRGLPSFDTVRDMVRRGLRVSVTEKYELAIDGMDAEIGVLLPHWHDKAGHSWALYIDGDEEAFADGADTVWWRCTGT